jgi:hypothetical protein
MQPLRFQGLPKKQLEEYLNSIPGLTPERIRTTMELFTVGAQAIMKSDWKPNGGVGFKQTKGYETHRRICAHEFATRHNEGRLFIIRESDINAEDLASLHLSPLTIAEKRGKKPRVCHHLSKSTDPEVDNSYNFGVNIKNHRCVYECDILPSITSLCTMMGRMRDAYPQLDRLDMATVDVRTAYNQFLLQVGKAKYMVTKLSCPSQPDIPLLVISLVGVFGATCAGDNYTYTITNTINTAHNAVDAVAHLNIHPDKTLLRRSESYIDDGITVAPGIEIPASTLDTSRVAGPGGITTSRLDTDPTNCLEIHRSVIDMRTIIDRLFGAQAIKEDKVQIAIGGGVAIGWDFDLRYDRFRVYPKKSAIEKMIYFLWIALPIDLGPIDSNLSARDPQTNAYLHPTVPSTVIESLRGLLVRYSTVIPLSSCHVYSLFKLGTENKYWVRLTPMAARDIAYWRTIILLLLQYPHLFGALIDNLRIDKHTGCYMNTDGCTSIGGGGTVTSTPNWIPGHSSIFFVIRWWHELEQASLDELHALLLKDAEPDSESGEKALQTVSGFQINVIDECRTSLLIHINVREFTVTCAGLWIHITILADKVTDIGGDNTACLCWIIKHKATNFMADRILKITSLLCYRFRVQIKDHKIAGKVLFQPDWLSRAQGINYMDPQTDYGPVHDEEHFFSLIESGCEGNYTKLCRIVLQRCLTTNSFVSFNELYRTVTIMAKYAHNYQPPQNPAIIKILDAIQHKHGSAPLGNLATYNKVEQSNTGMANKRKLMV